MLFFWLACTNSVESNTQTEKTNSLEQPNRNKKSTSEKKEGEASDSSTFKTPVATWKPRSADDAELQLLFLWPTLSPMFQSKFSHPSSMKLLEEKIAQYLYGTVVLKASATPSPNGLQLELGLVLEEPLFSNSIQSGVGWIQSQNLAPLFEALW